MKLLYAEIHNYQSSLANSNSEPLVKTQASMPEFSKHRYQGQSLEIQARTFQPITHMNIWLHHTIHLSATALVSHQGPNPCENIQCHCHPSQNAPDINKHLTQQHPS